MIIFFGCDYFSSKKNSTADAETTPIKGDTDFKNYADMFTYINGTLQNNPDDLKKLREAFGLTQSN